MRDYESLIVATKTMASFNLQLSLSGAYHLPDHAAAEDLLSSEVAAVYLPKLGFHRFGGFFGQQTATTKRSCSVCSKPPVRLLPSNARQRFESRTQVTQIVPPNRIPTRSPSALRSRASPSLIVIAPHTPNSISHPHRYVFFPGHPHHRDVIVVRLLLYLLQKPNAETNNRKHRNTSYHSAGDNSLVQADIRSIWWGGACDAAAGRKGRAWHGWK